MLMFDIVSPKSLKDKENFLRLIESRIIIVENEIYRYQRQLKKSNFGTKIFLLFEFTTENQAHKILEDFRFELEALKKEQIIMIDMINEQRRDRKKEYIRVNMRQYNVENIVFQHYLLDSRFYRKDLRTLQVEVALNDSYIS